MATPTALLNSMAQGSSSPYNTRKRPLDSDALDASPSKRQAVARQQAHDAEHKDSIASDAACQRARKSITRLAQRSTPAATPVQTRRLTSTYDHPESPESARKKDEGPKDKPKTRKVMRRLKQTKRQTASPFKGRGFGQLAELQSGAVLQSFDSPAKNTRSKRPNPLESLSLDKIEEPADLQTTSKLSSNTRVGKEGQQQDESALQTGARDEDENVLLANQVETPSQLEPEPKSGTAPSKSIATGQEEKKTSKSLSTVEREKRLSGKGKGRAQPEENLAQQSEESENEETSTAPRLEQPRKRKGRPPMSEEEKNARKEAEARRRQENAEESEAATLLDFDKRSKKFVEDIEHLVHDIGGADSWSKLGGGAKTITAMMAKKDKMDTRRAEATWRTMRNLAQRLNGLQSVANQEAEESLIADLLYKFQERANKSFLTKDDPKRGDQTVVNLFEYIIPQSVFLLKDALHGRFHSMYRHSWQEMRLLTKASLNLCETATNWIPRPSTLETGIRKQVRQNIRPALQSILEAIDDSLDAFDHRDKAQRNREELAKAQKTASERRLLLFKRIQAGMASCRIRSSSNDLEADKTQRNVVDVDELSDEDEISRPIVAETRPSRLLRQATEEIPAPDPVVIWTREEEYALLNGLQSFRGIDRYTRILEKYSWLARKDIDQCMARARYYKQAYRHILAEKAARGDHSSDWLASV